VAFTVLLGDQPRAFLADADEKTDRIVRDNLERLADDPYPRPGAGSGDRSRRRGYLPPRRLA